MPITFHPKIGQMLYCDFTQGFKEPEMVKAKRPVIVISGDMKGRAGLVTVVALSTKVPDPIRGYPENKWRSPNHPFMVNI